ncbi:hypothetical protein [Clostridioides sp. ZZV14-6153]|uniref:hypothetical protein n=1 Tax=Clostridioides sp. ZZV14-6153 TaxID=2811494 RepID=UPI001D12DB40|nr:hypothetical protein [Clostridioides sp. ZZV14-6153]
MSFYEMNGELPKEYTFRLYALKKFLKCEKYCFDDFWIPSIRGYEKNGGREIKKARRVEKNHRFYY